MFRTEMRFAHCEIVVTSGAVFMVRCRSDGQNFTFFKWATGVLHPCVCVHYSILDRPHRRTQTIVIQLTSYNSNLNLSGSLHVLSNFWTEYI